MAQLLIVLLFVNIVFHTCHSPIFGSLMIEDISNDNMVSEPMCKTVYKIFILIFTFFCYTSYHLSRKPISIIKSVLHRQNCSIPLLPGQPVVFDNTTDCDWAPFDNGDFATLLGSLDLAYLFAYAVGMFLSGHVAERMNLRHFLSLGMILSGVMTAAFGIGYFAGIHYIWYYIIVQVLGGLVQASGWPSVVATVGNWYGKGKRGLIMGIWNSHTSVGNILGSLIAGVWVNYAWGWSFVVPGIIIAAMGVLVFLFMVTEPSIVGCDRPVHNVIQEEHDKNPVAEEDVIVTVLTCDHVSDKPHSEFQNGGKFNHAFTEESFHPKEKKMEESDVKHNYGNGVVNGAGLIHCSENGFATSVEPVSSFGNGVAKGAGLVHTLENGVSNGTGPVHQGNGIAVKQKNCHKEEACQCGAPLPQKQLTVKETLRKDETLLRKKDDDHKQHEAISLWRALLIPGVVEFSLCLFFAKLVSYTFLFWLPKYIAAKADYDAEVAGDLSTLFDVGGIAGGIIAGVVSDYTRGRATTCCIMLLLGAPMMFIYNEFGSIDLAHSIGLLLVCGFFVNGPYALITTAVSADLGTHKSLKGNSRALATVTAIIDGTGSIGAAIGPLLTGVISPTGWNNVFWMLIAADVFAMVFLIRLVFKEIKLWKLTGCTREIDDISVQVEGTV